MKVKTAVITAAGYGTRFLPVVKSVPKEMLVIIDKPIIHYLVDECIEAGMEKIIIVYRKGNELLKDYFQNPASTMRDFLEKTGKLERFKEVDNLLQYRGIEFVEQLPELPYGNGSPILSSKPMLDEGEPFAMLFGDDVVITGQKPGAVRQLVEYFENNSCDGVLATQRMPQSELKRYGVIKPKQELSPTDGKFDYLIEKPQPGQEPSDMASYGRQILSYKVFDYLVHDATGLDNELWLQDANAKMAEHGDLRYKVIDGHWYTTGDPVRLFEAQVLYFLNHLEYQDKAREMLKSINL